MTQTLIYSLFIVAVVWLVIPPSITPIILKLRKAPRIPKNKKEFHSQYMQSNEWRKVRKKRLEKDKYLCQNHYWRPVWKDLQVHHKTYKRLGKERQSDLITLCRTCHNKIHRRK